MRFSVRPNGRLYNLDTDLGLFKLKPVPWKWKFPMMSRNQNGRLEFCKYMPWHRWRVSPGEAMEYVGGWSIGSALENMVTHYSAHPCNPALLRKWGENNLKFHPVTEA